MQTATGWPTFARGVRWVVGAGRGSGGRPNLSSHDPKVGDAFCGRAFAALAESDLAESRDLLLRTGERRVAADDRPPRADQARDRGSELLERGMNRAKARVRHCIDAHDAGLELRDFGECGVDAVLDRADLGCDFESGVLDLMLTHDGSFPREQNRADMVAGKKRDLVSASR